jgi:hypothetical protein
MVVNNASRPNYKPINILATTLIEQKLGLGVPQYSHEYGCLDEQ